MRASRSILALLLFACTASTAPAPISTAKTRLESLKKRLPAVLEHWAKVRFDGPWKYSPVLRRVRLTGAGQAKVVVHLHLRNDGKVASEAEYMVTVYLTYYDGVWTAARFQWSDSGNIGPRWEHAGNFLMDAIDEAAEK